MPLPRRLQIAPEIALCYQIVSRCVRRAFLCGTDQLTGRSSEHRRSWIAERLALLVEVLAVDVCAYAVLSNHFHLSSG